MKRTLWLMASVAMLAACSESAADEPTDEVASAVVAEGTAVGTVAKSVSPTAITCIWPAQAGDTAESLKARFDADAVEGMAYGAEGMEIPAVILWGDDPARKVEVLFGDDARREITSIRILDDVQWTIGGLSYGDTLAETNAANGRPFLLFGFEWDYGGMVSDWKGGALASLDGCRAYMSLGPTAETRMPDGTLGDMELSSDDMRLPQDGITIWEIGLAYPE